MFSISWGIVAWIIPEELMPLHLRANAIGLCVISNWVADYFTVATWLSITTAVSAAGGCLFYTVINAGALWFVWAMVPETRGIALEALEVLHRARSHCRFALLTIHFLPDSLRDSVPLL